MGLSRRGGAKSSDAVIWPGFVDAMTALLMVLMFVLTIFMVVQSVLREEITHQGDELNSLTAQVASLADALGLERQNSRKLKGEINGLQSNLTAATAKGETQSALIATLTSQLGAKETALAAATTRISSFEAQVATLLTQRDAAKGEAHALSTSLSALQTAQARLISEQEALQIAVAKARSEVDAQSEAARLAAARRDAIAALMADLQAKSDASSADLTRAQTQLSQAEAARLVDQSALQALQDRLKSSDTELTAMTLALEEQRRKAEETLTLLAAAQSKAAGKPDQASLLNTANAALAAEKSTSAAAARQVALLNEQVAALRGQLGALQDLLDAAASKDSANKVQLEALGGQLNSALAQTAAEQKRRAELEAAERQRLEAETKDLAKYRSEFFGQMSQLLAGRDGVRVVGDRFVFSSEVLFTQGSAVLAPEGRAQIASVVQSLQEIAGEIPKNIDWIIRVDGHTDNLPLSGLGEFADNWQLSQARALSVVRYMQNDLGFPPNRLAATGFGEYQPVAAGDSPEARAQNRRIELKLTER